MKMKRFISAFAALAMSVSCFAGLAITANAESTTETATKHSIAIWSWTADSRNSNWELKKQFYSAATIEEVNTKVKAVDQDSDLSASNYYVTNIASSTDFASKSISGGVGPSSNSSNYPSIGAIQFTFDNTDNATIASATFTGKVSVSGSNRTASLYTAANGAVDLSTVPVLSTASETNDGIWAQTATGTKWTYSNILGDLTSFKNLTGISGTTNISEDITTYISGLEKSADNKYHATIVISNANAGATLTDASIAIEYADASAVEKDITINYVYGDENTPIPEASVPESAKKTDKAYSGTAYTYDGYPTTFDAEEEGTTYRYTFAGETTDATIASVDKDADNVITLKYTRVALAKKDVLIKLVDKTSKETIKTLVEQQDVLETTKINYAYPMYITDENGKVTHKCSATTYTGTLTVSETDANNTVSIEYEAYSGNAWFVEAEDVYNTTSASDTHFSGGAARRSINSFKKYMDVAAPGIYKITYASCTSNAGSNADGSPKGGYISLYKNSQTEDNLIVTSAGLTGTWNNMTITTVSDVSLAKGDALYTLATQTTGCLDYMLLEKTGDIPPAAEVKSGALFTPVKPATGEQETVSFDTLIGEDTLATKTIAVTIYDTEEAKPTMSINGGTEFTPAWTAKTNETAGTRTFYAQFMAAEDDFDEFGPVVVKYGGQTVLSQTLVTNSDPTP